MVQDNNLYGDNVNIAARLESISKPGEICISEKVYQEIKNKVDISFKFMGTKKLKNISEKINVYLSAFSDEEKSSLIKKFPLKNFFIVSFLLFLIFIVSFLSYKLFFTEKINYNQGAKSVMETLSSEEDLQSSKSQNDKTMKISIMEFQNQSSSFSKDNLELLMKSIRETLTEEDLLSTIKSPEGSENLNPPEVMLIATEANSAFVINGIIFSEKDNDYLSIKIYESKRGSMIVSKKINLDKNSNFNEVVKFLSLFKNDIIK